MNYLETELFFHNSLLDWIYFTIAFFASFIISTLIARVVVKILIKTSGKTKTKIDDIIIEIISDPLKLAMKALALYASFYLIVLPESLENFIHHFLNSVVIFSIFWGLHSGVEILNYSLSHISDKVGDKLSTEVINFLAKALKVVVVLLGIMTILQQWDLNVSGFVASLGLGGLAFALAAKDTAANFFGSIVIFIDKPFKLDDWVQIPEVEGTIVDIGIRSTKVRTFAQAIVTVPNANFTNSAIINWSRMGKRRIKTTLGLTYSTTPEQITAILEDLKSYLKEHPGIDDETIFVNFSGFAASQLEIFCYFFTKTTNWGEFMEIREKVFLEFMNIITHKHKASFAFPSQSIYIEKGDMN